MAYADVFTRSAYVEQVAILEGLIIHLLLLKDYL